MTKEYYAIDLPSIRMGDIVFAAEQKITGNLSKRKNVSRFSRILICIDYGVFVQVLPNGDVKSISARNMLFRSVDDFKVLRYCKKLSNSTIQLICDYAKSQVGKKFSSSLPEVISNKSGNRSNRECNHILAVEAYNYAGINILNDQLIGSSENILAPPLLDEVGNIARIASREEIEGSKSPDHAAEQARIINGMFQKISKETKSDIKTFKSLNDFIVKNKTYDEIITTIIKESGYLDMWKGDLSRNEWKYSMDALSSLNLSPDLIEYLCEAELSHAHVHLDLYVKMMKYYQKMAEDYSLWYAKVMEDLCRTLVSFMESKRKTFQMAQSLLPNREPV